MLDAKLLPTFDKNSQETLTVYGVWMPRKGDNLRLTVEVVWTKFAVLKATLFQKNYDEVGDGTTAGVSLTFSLTTGRQTMELLGAKELVRVQLELDPGGDVTTGVGLVAYRLLQPVWFESVKA